MINESLNYNHLYYFWIVSKEGNISKAAKNLRLSQPTVSAQLKLLEDSLGTKLYLKDGRSIKLTEAGRIAQTYADDIFGTARELKKVLQGGETAHRTKLVIGLSDVIPKLIAFELLKKTLSNQPNTTLVCHEDRTDRLLLELAQHRLDLVITDTPLAPNNKIKGYHHLLGESTVSFFANAKLYQKCKRGFPQSLNGAPLLLPTQGTSIRQNLDIWFDSQKITPNILGEFDDTALIKIFGKEGFGIFPAQTVIASDVSKRYQVKLLGTLPSIKEKFYAITVERKIRHPGVLKITNEGKRELFTG